jgi:phage recombination protein Bet
MSNFSKSATQMETKTNNTPAVQQPAEEKDRAITTYQVAGQDVKLSYNIVRNFLTKGEGAVTDQDLTQFISICKYNQLNPFLNEAYLVKFGSKPAQMIVSKEALMKRAEACDTYEGIQAGIIVLRGDQAVELEGCFYMPGDKLVGGWAKVYRSDKKFPFVAKVRFEEYNKGQSTWNEKPTTMIRKVAEVQALREAFPTQLGAMYTAEEQSVPIVDAAAEDVTNKIKAEANKKTLNIDDMQPTTESAYPNTPNGHPDPNGEPGDPGQAGKPADGALFEGQQQPSINRQRRF